MSGLNLSDWALKHRSFIVFLMIAATLAGVASFFNLGRAEDPPFTFRTMIVQAAWPGATMDDTLQQVTERIERKLQETRGLDFLRSYTTPGLTTIFVNLKGSTSPSEVPDIWYQVRKNIGDIRGTLPAGVVGPGFNDDFGDTFGLIYGFTADGFTHRELRDYVEDIRSRLLQVPDVSKIELIGAQNEQIFVEFSVAELAGLGIDRAALIAALRAQNAVSPSGELQTGDETISLRVSGAFRSEADLLDVNFLSNGRLIRLRDIATVQTRLFRSAAADVPRQRQAGDRPRHRHARRRRHSDARPQRRTCGRRERRRPAAWRRRDAGLRSAGRRPDRNRRVHGVAWQAIAIIMAVSIISLGLRPGSVVALTIPLTIAIVFPIMEAMHIDLQRISLGALIISLSLLVDSAMTTIDVMTTRLASGDSKEEAASFAYKTLALPMLTGTFVTIAGFVPIGFARSAAGEYTFSIFAVVTIALIVSWFVAVLFAPLLGVWLLKKPEPPAPLSPISSCGRSARSSSARCGCAGLRIAVTLACFAASLLALPYVPRQFFPASDRPELTVDLTLPQNASIYASEAASAKLDAMLKDDPDVASWSTYVGRGAIRFYLPLDVKLANDFFSQAVVIAKDVPARERLHAKLEKALAEQLPNAVVRVSPLELGPPVGWPVQYRVSGPDPPSPRHRAQARPGDGRKRQSAAGQLRLDGAFARGPGQDRPGSGAASRPELADAGRDAERRHERDADHPGPRRHLSRQCRRPRQRRAARLAFDPALAATAAPRRADGALEPDRDLRLRSGISADLAARPRSDPDRPGRRQRRRDAGRRGSIARAGDREARGGPAAPATTSPPAARSRRAPSRRPRCSRSCPRRCS